MIKVVNNMKCTKCKFDNIVKASYCSKCGNKFTAKEKEKAYNNTIYGKIEKLEKIKDIISLDVITGNIVFKIFSLIFVLGIGIYFLMTMGVNTKILNSSEYEIFYNKNSDEYYLLVDDSKQSVNVSMYIPNRAKEMIIYHYDINDNLIDETKIEKDQTIELDKFKDDYYIIESKYSNKKKDNIKLSAYHKSDIK